MSDDHRTKTPANEIFMNIDVEDTSLVGFVDMLQAIWKKGRYGDKGAFDIFREESIALLTRGNLLSTLKEALTPYCNASVEQERCASLAKALNTIILASVTSDASPPTEIVFVQNSHTVAASDANNSANQLKPDIVGVDVSHLRSKLSSQYPKRESRKPKELKEPPDLNSGSSYSQCLEEASKWNPRQSWVAWPDVLISVDLKKRMKNMTGHYENITFNDSANFSPTVGPPSRNNIHQLTLDSPTKATGLVVSSSEGSLKRKTSPINFEASSVKKSRTDEEDERQMAFYGLERLRCRPLIAHSIVILFSDGNVSIKWYDPEGAILTHLANFFDNVELLVTLTRLLQKFDASMWGDYNGLVNTGYNKGTPSDLKRPYAIKGRHTIGCPVQKDGDEREYWLKASLTFPETARKAEADFITEARAAAIHGSRVSASVNVIPPDAASSPRGGATVQDDTTERSSADGGATATFQASWVLDHIPEVIASGEVQETNTSIIRNALSIKTYPRVLRWMITPLCIPFNALYMPNPDAFYKCFWELIRCHYILWVFLGVAHGDISVANLMIQKDGGKVILGDFDLAGVIEEGKHSPERQGHQRTGTKPFMSERLLGVFDVDNPPGRTYGDDLESFCHCLLWLILVDGFPADVRAGSPGTITLKRNLLKNAVVGAPDAVFPCPALWPGFGQFQSVIKKWYTAILTLKLKGWMDEAIDFPTPEIETLLNHVKDTKQYPLDDSKIWVN
ncbi:hypothetical protein CYLTODRAFT_491014 [Cylindrobasidium torrendii FP15055 ss-10]|uniref:Fungal-type protein kinase domain-containing protein n=1 Tax=Cylindrobasidium torrendii FP15055 ss-10 TaxID=1314674 RepID=A0A0D7BBW0_9AGAR|nr:hypothetical protein CYLTODRAFT_491014 [Cylindrobasidium torrendii FP15055 ss-10]